MAEKAYIVNDIITAKEDDINQRLEDVPVSLESKALDELRWDNTAGEVVDAALETDFYIDDNGVKHLQNYADDAVSISRSIAINRRAVPLDSFDQASGDFTTDGFTVGSIINVIGSTSCDGVPLKISTVTALKIEIDEDFNRIPADETAATITLVQGWQRLEGIDFNNVIGTDANGLFYVKSDNELQDDAEAVFRSGVLDEVRQHVITETPYPERHRSPPEANFALSKIVRASATFTGDEGLNDVVNFGGKIYNKDSAQSVDVSVTFDATNNKIVRTTGDFTTDGYGRTMQVTVTGSTNNNRTYTIKSIAALELGVSDADAASLVQEGPVTCTLSGIHTITGYEKWRNSDNPGEVIREIWNRWMQEGVAQNWFDDVADKEKDWIGGASTASAWETSTTYALDDIVFDPDSRAYYICTTAHTSGTGNFQTDIANWGEYRPEDVVLPDYPVTQIAS